MQPTLNGEEETDSKGSGKRSGMEWTSSVGRRYKQVREAQWYKSYYSFYNICITVIRISIYNTFIMWYLYYVLDFIILSVHRSTSKSTSS